MRWIGLDSKDYALSLANSPRTSSSSLHLRARNLLKEEYPLDRLSEEVFLPGCPSTLYVDFLLISRHLAIECQGEQHYKMSSLFHRNKLEYLKSIQRDLAKKEVLKNNGFCLVEFPYDESDAEWRSRLRVAVGGDSPQTD